ncbi:MAG: Mrr restriction system protein [candidate division Zixibacteria bacterium]|nr:Mrr restriction system protein [candidate division Zixibacteria bacterium]MDH3939052.1 Mrr restriction system protein [candidate division Zixibacteria bacterium]MDH4035250.1 Mrr restriction system protein [candidate division Zixibacteria bacterium]
MAKSVADLPKSKALGARLIHAALSVLCENDRELKSRQVLAEVENQMDLDDWAKERYQKSGYIRWQSILHFYSIGCVKAGFIVKKKGVWYLTDEGYIAAQLSEFALYTTVKEGYSKWKAERDQSGTADDSDEEESGDSIDPAITVDRVQHLAADGIKEFIAAKNAYEFQDLVAALLRGMGYYTPFVAPRGKDGGVDILAYRDPFGIESPRIKVQVKHRQDSASVQEIRQLMGILQKDGDVGIFVSTGGYTSDAKSTATGSHIHVQLIDLDGFINLWTDFYPKLTDEDKSLLPLTSVYLVAPTD